MTDARTIYWANRIGRTPFERWAIRSDRHLWAACALMVLGGFLALTAWGAAWFALLRWLP